jgi:hypothetical protein
MKVKALILIYSLVVLPAAYFLAYRGFRWLVPLEPTGMEILELNARFHFSGPPVDSDVEQEH